MKNYPPTPWAVTLKDATVFCQPTRRSVNRRFPHSAARRLRYAAMAFAAACCGLGTAGAVEYFAAPNGSPDGRGTAEAPWDIESVFAGRQPVEPGSTVYFKGGVYRHPNRTRDGGAYRFAMKGAEGLPVHVRPVSGERVTIDGGMTVENAEDVWLWDLEFTVSEALAWDRRVEQAGSHIEDDQRPAGGITVNSARRCKFINLVVRDNPSTGISFWRMAVDCELHGCLIYRNGWIGPDRYHGPGIYTQNDEGRKWITDCIFWGNYSTTIQAYGSANAFVNNFHIVGNIAFAPLRAGGRQRILVGGGRPSHGIVAAENILYEVPLQIGYTAPHNDDCAVHDNTIVNADMSIQRYRNADERNNYVLAAGAPRPEEPARVILRPNKYDPNRAHLAVFNWLRAEAVPVDPAGFLKRGDRFRILSALDVFGRPVAEGTFDGRPVDVPMPANADTGGGEFCAFVLFRD